MKNNKQKKPFRFRKTFLWCQLDSNQRHKDFQSFALPTELWHLQVFVFRICYLPDFWWCQLDSNQRHKDFQSFALPTELWHLFFDMSVTELAMQIYRPFSNSKTFALNIFVEIFKVLILIEIKLHEINIGNGQITVSLHFNKIL